MKIALYSDLHLELASWHPPALDVDVVILAGDIGSHTHGIRWAARTFRTTSAVLYLPGNHEFYGAHVHGLRSEMRRTAARLGVNFLDNDVVEISGVRFLGTTLWSDFRLYEDEERIVHGLHEARYAISDYSCIRKSGGFIEPRDTVVMHRNARAWLEQELAKPFAGKTVVITHFAPHRRCVAPEYEGEVLTPYFVVDMAPVMRAHRIDLWSFGHTHYNVDVEVENGCRLVSNQRGYPSEWRSRHNGFRPELIIEL